MPIKGLKSLTHTGQDYTTRKGSKFYVRNGKEVRPYKQKTGGATINKALLVKLLGGALRMRAKPRRSGGAGYFVPGYTRAGFF